MALKEVNALQAMEESWKEVTAKFADHPSKQDAKYCTTINSKEKAPVDEITQQYKDFKIKINEYTVSSWRDSRMSHKFVLGAC